MKHQTVSFGTRTFEVYTVNTVVLGTGAAGYNAADRLYQYGQTDVVIVTEGVFAGTSRNTGSDKQTYYKLSLSSGEMDSVLNMARSYFAGQCVDGDTALCEAALSAQCFLKLVELGVPFPKNRYGEYIGYQTDHATSRRATSAGPYTSKWMTRCLQQAVQAKHIETMDHLQAIRILTRNDTVCGLLCLDTQSREYVLFSCTNLVLATGGPAEIYADSVYPLSQMGASGLAFEVGVEGQNLTEWQYGLASVAPRWNVSGTFMQCLPRFISTDQSGNDPREFLTDFFRDRGRMLSMIFLKGYQWPFDVSKVAQGSSIIDLLVYQEKYIKDRRVFLDFTQNPNQIPIDFDSLIPEANCYLSQAGACFGTPIERLLHMNEPAVGFYQDHNVDLRRDLLEIALCAQHNNGGLSVDRWWQTNKEGLFAVGEVSGTHGVYRPGGSALNAGQVGSTRAAQYIAAHGTRDPMDPQQLAQQCGDQVLDLIALGEHALRGGESNLVQLWNRLRHRMSCVGASIRNVEEIHRLREELQALLANFGDQVIIDGPSQLAGYYRLREMVICQLTYLSAMEDYAAVRGVSRGSALYTNEAGDLPYGTLPELFRFLPDDGSYAHMIQQVHWSEGGCRCHWRPVRPIPEEDDFFENVWRTYRENQSVY